MRISRVLFFLVSLVSATQLVAQDADAIRGGWIADVDGTRHVYLLVVRGEVVTGIYCTQCSNPMNLAFVDDGVLDESGLRFTVNHDPGTGDVATDSVTGEIVDGLLHLTRRSERAAEVSMVLHRSPAETVRASPPGGFRPIPAPYVSPGPSETLSKDNVLGMWLAGNGPDKQYFIFREHRGQIRGMACGQCDDTSDMAVIDGTRFDGVDFHFDIAHEDSGPGIIEYGPHRNITRARVSRNEMHIWVVPSFEPDTFTPIEMTLLGPVDYRP